MSINMAKFKSFYDCSFMLRVAKVPPLISSRIWDWDQRTGRGDQITGFFLSLSTIYLLLFALNPCTVVHKKS